MSKQHQVKAKWYYIFWGAMAIAVVGGQIYVGLGYRKMAEATNGADIRVTCEVSTEYGLPTPKLNTVGEFE